MIDEPMIHTVGSVLSHWKISSTSSQNAELQQSLVRDGFQNLLILSIVKATLKNSVLTQFILDCGSPKLTNGYKLDRSQPENKEIFRISRYWGFTINSAGLLMVKTLS